VLGRKRSYLTGLFLIVSMLFGFATFCMASGGADVPIPQPSGHTPGLNLYLIGWSAVNFFILLAIVYKFAYNPINAMLEQRTATIESSLKHAEDVKSEIEEMRKETQANLAESRKEAQDIISRANKAAEEAKNEILTKAKEEAENMKNKATAEIQAATEQAKMELRDTVSVLAVTAAAKILDKEINEADHKKMVEQFINEAGDLLC